MPNVSASGGNFLNVRLPDALFLDGSVTDDGLPAGSSLVINWSLAYGPGNVSFADSTQPSTLATFSAPGTYTLQLTASDGSNLGSVSSYLDVYVHAANTAPVVTASVLARTIDFGTPASLSGSVTDDGLPTGNTLMVQWKKVYGPGAVAYADASQSTTSATFSQPGAYLCG